MKNKGLLMIVLILAFCGVLSVYAMTEGTTEQLEIDADEVTNIIYLCTDTEVCTMKLNLPEDISCIVEEVNALKLRPAHFKISDEEIQRMTYLLISFDESGYTQDIGLFFLSDGRLLVSQGTSDLCYTTDCEKFIAFANEYISEAAKKYPPEYAGFGIWINLPDELQE